jgi:microcin C transport system permease protein
MGAYILRRLLLVIPTLVGIMLINFGLTQFVPGGPIEQVLANIQGEGDVLGKLTGAEGDAGGGGGQDDLGSKYLGARGLPPEFIAELELEFGFARIVCADGTRMQEGNDPGDGAVPDDDGALSAVRFRREPFPVDRRS